MGKNQQKENGCSHRSGQGGCNCGWPAALGHGTTKKTRIIVRAPAGSKDPLFLRGEGGGNLTWAKGVPLDHVRGNEWCWETWDQIGRTEFKVLINDKVWEEGPNHVIEAGHTVEYTAKFPQ